MGQMKVALTPDVIENIRRETKQDWRKCRRKQYNIFACKVPAGYVFANKLEQPDSYNAIKRVFHKDIISVDELNRNPQLASFLNQNGCYKTDGTRIVLCGTKGELWDVKPEKFVQSYRRLNGAMINDMPECEWVEVSRASEAAPSAVGIQLPKKYLGVYQTSWATLFVNNPNSQGHGTGDILVAPLLPNGQPDYSGISPTNNEVFALTYDQGVGGWANSGLVTNVNRIKQLTLLEVKNTYKVHISVESLIKQAIEKICKACNSKVYEVVDDTIYSLYDLRLGCCFTVLIRAENNETFISIKSDNANNDRSEWYSKCVKLVSLNSVNAIIEEYNKHAQNIAVGFKSFCQKYNLKSLYSLSSKRKQNGYCFVDKVSGLIALRLLNNEGNVNISDDRIKDNIKDIVSANSDSYSIDFSIGDLSGILSMTSYENNSNVYSVALFNYSVSDSPYEFNLENNLKSYTEQFKNGLKVAKSGNF